MFDGIRKRVVCMWFPRLASDRALRARPVEAPFALIVSRNNAERLACVNVAAESRGLWPGMNLADARAFCPDLVTRTGDPQGDRAFLVALRRCEAETLNVMITAAPSDVFRGARTATPNDEI